MSYILNGVSFDTVEDFMEAYFKEAAVKLLGHSEERQSFFVNYETSDVSEIENALSSKLKLPALILDSPDDDISGASDRYASRYTAAITVIDKYKDASPASLKETRNRCRAINRKIVMRMLRDSLMPFGGVLISNKIYLQKRAIPGMYLGKMAGLFTGWTYEFEWEVPENIRFGEEDFAAD